MKTVKLSIQLLALNAGGFLLALAIYHGAVKLRAQVTAGIKPYQIWYHMKITETNYPVREADSFKAQTSNGDAVEESGAFWSPGSVRDPTRLRTLQLRSRGLMVTSNTRNAYITTFGASPPQGGLGSMTKGNNCEAYGAEITGESKTLLGYKTLRLAGKPVTNQDPTNGDRVTITTEAWLAPDLDCEALLEITTWLHNDVQIGVSTKTAMSANRNELPDSAFEIPAGSVEVPPSVFRPSIGQGFSQKSEDAYNRQKAQREARGLR